ncbi:MAG: DUF2808 domain-containing protein [Synechococcales bacterium]|nr:DUF2808 domain-containing protein [Synechococcales bacterium]
MSFKSSTVRRFLAAFAATGCLMSGWALPSLAGGLPGLTIFSGVDREFQLGYRLQNEGQVNRFDRYYLRIPAEKLALATDLFVVTYPDTYNGRFDTEDIEVRIGGDAIPLQEVVWDEENRFVEIVPVEPVPARSRVELVFSNVRNPRNTGTHYFNAMVRAPGDVLPPQYVGTWILSFGRL